MQFSKKILDLTAEAEEKLAPLYREIDAVSFRNTEKIMNAFRQHRVSDSMFGTSSGYGNNDRGREVLDEIWAEVMGAEAAFVRVGIVSGTMRWQSDCTVCCARATSSIPSQGNPTIRWRKLSVSAASPATDR